MSPFVLIETVSGALQMNSISPSPGVFNPWCDHCEDDEPCNGPDAKLARLAAHLDSDPEFILCGEAPSHRGWVPSAKS
jgi:hypothetical protein